MQNFYTLTPDLVMTAVEKIGYSPTGHCMALNSYENRVYDIKLDDDSHIITKFYRPGRWAQQQILEEHAFLYELQNEEIPVCAPQIINGKSLHIIDGILFAVWKRTGGRIPDELSDETLPVLGRLIARIHNIGDSKKSESRLTLTSEQYGIANLKYLSDKKFLPKNLISRYTKAVNDAASIYDSLITDIPFHRIHGDCHLGNLLNSPDGWAIVDFDDFLSGPAVQDIWMMFPARDTDGYRRRDILLSAYREFRPFKDSWLRLIEPLRALRYINYSAWIARRWEDPSFKNIFPHFGTDQYWEDETRDIEEEINYYYEINKDIRTSSNVSSKQNEDISELTNKDYFWDM